MRNVLIARARGVVSSDDDARDVIQEAFYKLWSRGDTYEREGQAEAMLMTTVRNLSIDTVRRRKSHPSDKLDENSDICDSNGFDDEARAEIYRRIERIASEKLSERDRLILFRRDRDEWSFEEIAESFGTTPANVRMIVARARKTIRAIYNTQETVLK